MQAEALSGVHHETRNLRIRVIAGLLFTMLPTLEACAKDAVKEDSTTRACAQCDTIQAIVPRPIDLSGKGYFVYELFVNMDKTGVTHVVTVGTTGAMQTCDRVKIIGGTVEPIV